MSTIRVSHLIAALESIQEPADVIPYKYDTGVESGVEVTPRIYGLSVKNVIHMLKDDEHFDPSDPIIEINSTG